MRRSVWLTDARSLWLAAVTRLPGEVESRLAQTFEPFPVSSGRNHLANSLSAALAFRTDREKLIERLPRRFEVAQVPCAAARLTGTQK